MNWKSELKNLKERKTLCSAAWTDVRIDLSNMTALYCCRSQPIPLDINNIYHNKYIDNVRNDLSLNKISDHCAQCNKSYESTGVSYRDTSNKWDSVEDIKHTIENIEIKFDNFCDMSCVYCHPTDSHRIAKELGLDNIIIQSTNEHYFSIAKWIKEVNHSECILSFVGGELTFSSNFYNFMTVLFDVMKDDPLNISIITNGNTSGKRREKFYRLLEDIPAPWNLFVVISGETYGEQQELIRWGLDWSVYEENVKYYGNHPNVNVINLCLTLSAFSSYGIEKYLEWVTSIITEKPIYIDGNYVSWGPAALKNADVGSSFDKAIEVIKNTKNIENKDEAVHWLENMKIIVEEGFRDTDPEKFIQDLLKQKKNDSALKLKNYL